MKSVVTLYRRPWGTFVTLDEREKWFAKREIGFSYTSELDGEAAAEEMFHVTNAPIELLTEDQQNMLKLLHFNGPSLSVGDIVRVESYLKKHSTPSEYYLCKSFGWEKYGGDVIDLIKYMSW